MDTELLAKILKVTAIKNIISYPKRCQQNVVQTHRISTLRNFSKKSQYATCSTIQIVFFFGVQFFISLKPRSRAASTLRSLDDDNNNVHLAANLH